MRARIYKQDGATFTELLDDNGSLIASVRGTHSLGWMKKYCKIGE